MRSSFPLAETYIFGISPMHTRTSSRAHGFTDVTLAEKDGQPPGAHSTILRAVGPLFRKFLNENDHTGGHRHNHSMHSKL